MSAKAYMLLDILEDKSAQALQVLQTIKGVVADTLEGHPNIMVIIEAADRQKLVELMMPVLDSVDCIAKDVHLLVNRENKLAPYYVSVGDAMYLQEQSVN
jgi:hypothetical protein